MAGINSFGWIQYNLGYLLLYPDFECQVLENGSWINVDKDTDEYSVVCKPDCFCNNDTMKWDVVEDSTITLNNWMTSWDLICSSHLSVSLFGMLFFIGFAAGQLILPPLSDKYGRKKIFMGSGLVNLALMIIVVCMPHVGVDGSNTGILTIVYITMFINGICNAGRLTVGYVYFSEIVPTEW